MLIVNGIGKTYPGPPPVPALEDVDLQVEAGSIAALIGPNGAGKTTLASCLVGLIKPDFGEANLDGADLLGRRDDSTPRIGYAPQEEALYPIMHVEENLRLFGELAGIRGPDLRREIDRVAEAFLIGDLLGRRVRDLSGGQRRRVHNAIALLGTPRLIILDEPTAGVDPSTRSAILDVVRSTATQTGAVILYSTHYLAEVAELHASVTFLDRGRVIARGSVAELLSRHGADAVELRFDGPAPSGFTFDTAEIHVVDDMLRVAVTDPRRHVGRIVLALGMHAERLQSVDVHESDLDTVFFRLTGRRYSEDDDE
ncbi:MAG: ABC transporter ATP-binding protein [Microthrixaceae bacterium]|nr:ABC transporter ATP-binding protein [Microthrixaceae bacterium]